MPIYNITPVTKPRQTQRDKWLNPPRPAVARYRAFADDCRRLNMHIPEAGAHIIFRIPMPKSWSNKKKVAMNCEPHRQTPDLDNLEKAIFDAVLKQDCGVWDCHATKLWAYAGSIEIK